MPLLNFLFLLLLISNSVPMSILPQTSHSLRPLNHVCSYSYPPLASRTVVYCATTESMPNVEQLVVEPRLKPTNFVMTASSKSVGARPVQDDPSLQSTWSHRAWLASGSTTVLLSLAKSIIGASNSHIWLEPIFAGLIGYVLADLGSGVYHWAIDNYGSAETPVFGTQIDAFQGHHKWPWTITRRQFANNLHSLARVITFIVLPIDLISNDPVFLGFVGVCSGCIMFSQQFHAWAHGTKSKLPPLVVALQDAGVLVSRSAHAAHHRPPSRV